VLDRASSFADPAIVKLLQTRFVPVAIDQAYQRRQQDAEGDFYRRLAGQGPRNDFKGTTQGLYIGTAGGKLLAYNNNRSPERIRRLLDKALDDYDPERDARAIGGDALVDKGAADAGPADFRPDPRYARVPPAGGLVVRVHARVLGGYEPTDDRWQKLFQSAVARDNLWVTAAEQRDLAAGRVPDSLARRIARFHLIDNTRGEPPMWNEKEIRKLSLSIRDGRLVGTAHLETEDGKRGYTCDLAGRLEQEGQRVTRFDLVARGDYWGHGQFTPGCPKGKFPLGVAFRLADGSDTADAVPPQGSKGWLPGYIEVDK